MPDPITCLVDCRVKFILSAFGATGKLIEILIERMLAFIPRRRILQHPRFQPLTTVSSENSELSTKLKFRSLAAIGRSRVRVQRTKIDTCP
jgi:hypothetical protein